MKRLFLALGLTVATLSIMAQPIEEKPENQTVTRNVDVAPFSVLLLSGTCNVHLTQGSQVAVRVEADSTVQDKVLVETKGDTLLLSTNKGRRDRKKKINVYITFIQLADINSRITGELICINPIKQNKLRYKSTAMGNSKLQLEVDDLWLNIAANGDTYLSGKAHNCDFKNNSTGHIKAGELIVENMQISTAAAGGMEYYANNVKIISNISLGSLTNKKKKTIAQ